MSESISSILEDLKNPQTAYLEPGLLSVFRVVTGLQLALILLGFAGLLVGRNFLPVWVLGMGVVWLTALLLYLSWPGLHKRLGPWFLPPALIVSSIMPVFDRLLFLRFISENGDMLQSFNRIEDSSWRMLFFILFPLVLIAWQYGMARVLLYAVGITAMNIALNGWITDWTPLTTISSVPIAVGQGMALILIGYVVVLMISAQREQRAKLTEANSMLADYAATVDRLATSRERNRLARELHDTLSHTLSSLAVQLEAVESVWSEAPDQAHGLLLKSIANTRGGLAETRRALQDLRASPLDDLGLGLALRNLAESTARRAGTTLTTDIPKQIEGLSPEAEQCIYRVAQEALENVARHAQARNIRIALGQQTTGQWQLVVRDDGQGFDEPADVRGEGHYGLQGMQERAALLGGSLEITSQGGTGTEIRLVL